MKETTKAALGSWLTDELTRSDVRIQALTADHRGDEAVFEKIRRNVLDIFRTILRTPGADFAGQLDRIPRSWEAALGKAREYGETEKAHIESIKLEAAEWIRAQYAHLEDTV